MWKELLQKGVKRLDRMLNAPTEETRALEFQITEWLSSRYLRLQKLGEKYYLGEHDILHHERQVIGKNGQLETVKNLPNNRIVDNQYAIQIDKKAEYLCGQPVSFESKNETYLAEVNRIMNAKFRKTLKNLCIDALNQKIGWLHPYYKDGELRFKKFTPFEIMPIWTDSSHEELEKVVRLYEQVIYTGRGKEIQTMVEIYTKNGIERYNWFNNQLQFIETKPYLTVTVTKDDEVHEEYLNWERIPIIPFKYNDKEIAVIERTKSLQDGINLMLSTFENNMQEDSRNTILVLVNYDGQNLAEFRHNLQRYGAVKVRSENGGNGDLKTLQVEVKAENYKAIVELFKKALIQNARGVDITELRSMSGGSPNQMNIQSAYSDMDLDANAMETEFQAAFEDVLWFVNKYLQHTGKGDFDGEEISVIFNRDMMQDEALIIQSLVQLQGLVSQETLVGQVPFINDPSKEMQRIRNEQKEELDYAGMNNELLAEPISED